MHEIPETLSTWLALWQPSRKQPNEYARVPPRDVYCVFRTPEGTWKASVGRTFLPHEYPDAEAAKSNLYNIVRTLHPSKLAELHQGPRSRPVHARPGL